MKQLLSLTVAMSLLATASFARTIYYPQEACAEIMSSEYSTGGGDTAFELFEILCKSADGKYTAFITSWTSAAGFLGFGRAFHETQIDLIPYNGTELRSD
jgi:hypothetical protein